MNGLTGLFTLLLAIAVVENSDFELNTMPIKKVFSLLSQLNDVDSVSDLKIRRRYQLMYDAAVWVEARSACAQKEGKLAAPKTMPEFKLIQRLVRRMRFHAVKGATGTKHLAWVGISSLDDWTVWKNVDGEDIRNTGFYTWATGSGSISPDPTEPHCAGVDAVNLLRDYWCDRKQPYVCEYKFPEGAEAETSASPTGE